MKALIKSFFNLFGLDVVRRRRFAHGELDSVQAFLAALELRPGAICFDVGANTGQTLDALIDSGRDLEIHAFEPGDQPFAELQEKYGSNPRVRLVKSGVSSKSGTQKLFVNALSKLNSLHATNEASEFKQGEVIGEETITLVSLDEYCESNGIDLIDVLKIDVQGHEPEVIEGARRLVSERKIDWIIAEIQFGDFYATEGSDLKRVVDLLDGHYRVFAIIDSTYIGSAGAISHADFVFARNDR